MAKRHFFVAGTDTDVGKTVISAALLEKAKGAACTSKEVHQFLAHFVKLTELWL